MSSADTYAPGNVVVVRDEEWLVTSIDESADGPVLNAQGLSELVRGQDAVFYPSLDRGIQLNDPRDVTVRSDDSPKYRRSRLWVESTLRKTGIPLSDASLTVSDRMLARPRPSTPRLCAPASCARIPSAWARRWRSA